jgi:calcineurin-like phosphoesterase family protein
MTIWFTSDTHYYHKNIIKYSNRPYKHVDEMNEALIENYNKRVQKDDTCYHLGDFGFADKPKLDNVIRRLNGQKHLILGNHDHAKNFMGVFGSVHQYMEIKVPDQDARQGVQSIILFHYSMRVWNKSHYGAWQLYGHSHGTLSNPQDLLSMDVGVDPCGYAPISYEEVKELMKKKTFKAIDHHGRDD